MRIIASRSLHQAAQQLDSALITRVPMLMRRRTIAAYFSLAGLLAVTSATFPANAAQSSTSPSSSSAKKTAAHKHKHHAKRQPPGQKTPTADRISEIQSALARGGYYEGEPNGKLDSNMVAALEKFQSANGLDSTGKLDAPTLQKLGLGSDIAGVGVPKPVVPSCCSAQGSAATTSSAPAATCCSAPSSNSAASSNSNSRQSATGASASATGNAAPSDPKPAQQ